MLGPTMDLASLTIIEYVNKFKIGLNLGGINDVLMISIN